MVIGSGNKSGIEIEFRSGTQARAWGGVARQNERYPFGLLDEARLLDDNPRGGVDGPCFFIPGDDKPDYRLQLAKKRYSDRTFISRRAWKKIGNKDVPGVYVWRVALQQLRARSRTRVPQPQTEQTLIESARMLHHRLKDQSDPEPAASELPDNDVTRLVLDYLLKREPYPRKWIGRASTLREFQSHIGADGEDRTPARRVEASGSTD